MNNPLNGKPGTMSINTEIPAPAKLPEAAAPIHLPIVAECVNVLNPDCQKIYHEDGADRCRTYCNPAAIQHRAGMMDACGVMPRQDISILKKAKLKRKFGSRTR